MKYLISFALALSLYQAHDDAPYVACKVNGSWHEVEYARGHGMGPEDIEWMKTFCVRDALYGGRGEDYWTLPVSTDGVRFRVRNFDTYTGSER